MSNYTQATNFTAKDTLATGNPSKIVKGADIDGELSLISTAIGTKIDATTAGSPTTKTTLADADQVRLWSSADSAERQITASNAALYFGTRPTLTAVTALSGTSTSITGIASTSRRVTLMLSGVGYTTAGTTNIRIRIGDSSGVLTTNYLSGDGRMAVGGAGDTLTGTAGFDVYQAAVNRALYGSITFTLMDSTNRIWIANWDFYDSVGQNTHSGAGQATLPTGALDRVNVTTTGGTATITGNIAVLYD
jgi:hypothetical protein